MTGCLLDCAIYREPVGLCLSVYGAFQTQNAFVRNNCVKLRVAGFWICDALQDAPRERPYPVSIKSAEPTIDKHLSFYTKAMVSLIDNHGEIRRSFNYM